MKNECSLTISFYCDTALCLGPGLIVIKMSERGSGTTWKERLRSERTPARESSSSERRSRSRPVNVADSFEVVDVEMNDTDPPSFSPDTMPSTQQVEAVEEDDAETVQEENETCTVRREGEVEEAVTEPALRELGVCLLCGENVTEAAEGESFA